MKNNWEIKTLGEVCEYVPVTTKVLKKDFLSSGKFPIVSQESELISGFWNNDNDVFRVGKPVVVFGDHTRVLKYVDFDFVRGADGVKIILPISNLDTRYLYYYLSLFEVRHLGYARHFRLLKELEINYPNITEQKRIVKILDEKFGTIEELKKVTEKQIVDAKELFKSRLSQSVLTGNLNRWITRPIGEVVDLKQGLAINSKTDFLIDENGTLPLLRIKDLKEKTEEIFINAEKASDAVNVYPDDIIYTRTGQVGLVFKGFRGILHNNSFRVTPNSEVSREYIFWYLQSKSFFDQVAHFAKRAAQPDISHKSFKTILFSYPKSITEQVNIAKELDELSEKTKGLEAIFRRKIADLEELKKSYLEQAFAGKL